MTRTIEAVCNEYSVTLTDLKSARRIRRLTHPRQELYRRLIVDHGLTSSFVGRLLNKNHSTVLHGMVAAAQRLADAGSGVDDLSETNEQKREV